MINVYICILYDDFYVMTRCHEDTMMLRSTTGPYGRPMIEVAYGEMIARKEWLGCRYDASPMFDIPGSTPIWAQCILFSSF